MAAASRQQSSSQWEKYFRWGGVRWPVSCCRKSRTSPTNASAEVLSNELEDAEREESRKKSNNPNIQLADLSTNANAQCLFTSHIRHSFSSEDNTGKVVCQLGCQEFVTIGSSLLVSPHSFGCDESKCFLASATLTEIFFSLEKVMEALCNKLLSAFECTCTSVVHVAGHYRVEIPILEVEQKSSFRPVSFQAHQSVKNDLHRKNLNQTKFWLDPFTVHEDDNAVVQNLTAMLYGVGFPPSFQLQRDGPPFLDSVILWPMDLNSCSHIYFPFQSKSWRPNILFYVYQLGEPDHSCCILGRAWRSAVARAEETALDC